MSGKTAMRLLSGEPDESKSKVVVLISGGMDSAALIYHANIEHEVVGALSFDYGSKHNHKEIPFAGYHCGKLGIRHHVIKLSFINELFASDLLQSGGSIPDGHYEELTMKQTVVPFRNAVMLSICAGYAESIGANGVVIAAHAGDHAIYPDCRETFMVESGSGTRPPSAMCL
jgi:7-cyano-7-deazaguanine synthase